MVDANRLCLGCMNDNGGEAICPICGHNSSDDNNEKYLSCGTWLNANRYYVGKVIVEDSDGPTYIAWDNDENAVVHIKEYFPEGIAARSANRLTVTPAEDMGLAFNKGREEFARLFSRLAETTESVYILRISDLFESGGTIYAAQKAVSGSTLQAFLIRNGGALKWEQVKPLFMSFISTVSQLNEAGIYHRGICPDNIIIGRDGKLRLTGFCIPSVRRLEGPFIPQLPSGFAAPELYLENSENDQFCDIYSIGAVLFRALVGTTPPDAKDRLINDKLAIPTKITEIVPRSALVAVANALKVDPRERIGTADRLYKMVEAIAVGGMTTGQDADEVKRRGGSTVLYVIIAILITALIFIGALIFLGPKLGINLFGGDESSKKPSSSQPSSVIVSSSEPSGYGPDALLFVVPDIVGKTNFEFCETIEPEHSQFTFVDMGRRFSEEIPEGQICYQSIPAGSEVGRDTVIEYYTSAGAEVETAKLPNIIRQTKDMGELELYRAGFLKTSIEFRPRADESALAVEPGEVYRVAYAKGDKTIKSGVDVLITEPIIIDYRDPNFIDEEEDTTFPEDENSSSDFDDTLQ